MTRPPHLLRAPRLERSIDLDRLPPRVARARRPGALEGAAMFVDISGFTALTAALSEHGRAGAEALVGALRFYFAPVVDAVHARGGFVANFAGDALTAIFPGPPGRAAGSARGAARAAQRFFRDHPERETPFGRFPFGVKIGLAAGAAEWGLAPLPGGRAIPWFRGPAVDACAAAEGRARPGEIAIDGAPSWGAPLPPMALDLSDAPDAASLVPSGVAGMPALGEFRHVASAFVSFEGEADLEALVWRVGELSARYGGAFGHLNFGDKGQTLLVHFGAPAAHEDDLERAARFSSELLAGAPDGARARVGLSWGLCYAGFNGGGGRLEFACLGSAVNLAARLMVAAPWGEIWCAGEALSRGRGLSLQPRGERRFKGFPRPLPVAAVSGHARRAPRSERALCGVVRRAERARLLQALAPLRRGEPTGWIWIEGEAGAGKSALVEATRRALCGPASSVRWLHAPCDPLTPSAFHPLAAALRARLLPDDRRDPAALSRGLEALGAEISPREAGALQRAAPFLADVLEIPWPGSPCEGMSARDRRENTEWALGAWLLAEASAAPTALHLEDAHWCDAATLSLLAGLADRLGERAGAVICTARPGQRPDCGVEPAASIVLGALDAQEIAALASALLGAAPAPELVDLVAERAGGNPFFAEQILGWLADESLLEPAPEGLRPRWTGTVLPDGASALLIARLDRLPRAARRAVQRAAVVGREFPTSVLERLVDEPGELIALLSSERVWETAGASRLRFRHALLRDAAYEMQSRAGLRAAHAAVAAAWDALYGDRPDAQAPLAHHLERSGQTERARDRYRAAARRARDRCDFAEAERLYYAELRLREDPSPERAAARYELGRQVLAQLGEMDRARAALTRSLADALTCVDDRGEARARSGLATLDARSGALEAAEAGFRAALALHEAAGRELERGLLLGCLATVAYMRADGEAARRLFQESIAIVRAIGERNQEAILLNNLALLEQETGDTEAGRAELEEALRIAEAEGDRLAAADYRGNLAQLLLGVGELDAALPLFERSLATFREVGVRRQQSPLLRGLGVLRLRRGEVDAARSAIDASLEIAREIGSASHEGSAQGAIAWLLRLADGDLDAAEAALERAEALLRSAAGLHNAGLERAYLALARGQLDRAAAAVDALAASQDARGMHVSAEQREGLGRARAALALAERGDRDALYSGERITDLPAGLRRWLAAQGRIPRSEG